MKQKNERKICLFLLPMTVKKLKKRNYPFAVSMM